MIKYVTEEAQPTKLAPGSWGAMLYEAADRQEISRDDVPAMMFDYLGPSLDTTISAIGSMIWLLTEFPDQWRLLKEDRSLVPLAVVETVRVEPPLLWFSRVLAREHEIDGVTLEQGSRVVLLLGSANRDDRKYPQPDSFDVTRNAVDHVGWGFGTHGCPGGNLARLEMQAILGAMLDQFESIEQAQPPQRLISSGLRAFAELEIRAR